MANTQTTVPTFVDGQVLGAERLNQSAGTGVPVFATTVTRDAGFGGAGEKALAEGQLCYLESTNVVQYYDGAAWATLGPAPAVSSGLTFILKQTLTAASQHNLTNVFSASYDHYIVRFTNFSITGGSLDMRYGTSGTPDTGSNYSNNGIYNDSAQVSTASNQFNASFNRLVGNSSANMGTFLEISSPFLTQKTTYTVSNSSLGASDIIGNLIRGTVNTSTSYTDLVLFGSSGNISGVISIYGLANS